MTNTNYQINSEVLGQVADLIEELNGLLSYHELAPAIKFIDVVLAERSSDDIGLNLSLYNRAEDDNEVELVLVDIDTIELLEGAETEEEAKTLEVDGGIHWSKLPNTIVNQTVISQEEVDKAMKQAGIPNPYDGLKGHGL